MISPISSPFFLTTTWNFEPGVKNDQSETVGINLKLKIIEAVVLILYVKVVFWLVLLVTYPGSATGEVSVSTLYNSPLILLPVEAVKIYGTVTVTVSPATAGTIIEILRVSLSP